MGLRARRGSQVWGKAASVFALWLGAQMLTGCGGFFVYPGSTKTGSSGSTTGDYAFASNSTSGANYISAYSVSSGSLTAASGSPTSVSYQPQAMVVSTNNAYLFVSSGISVYGYNIASNGSLSQNGSGALANDTAFAMAASPDGQWLITLDTQTNAAYPTLNSYQILSGGTLKSGAVSSVSVNPVTGTTFNLLYPGAMAISPNGNYIAVALGTGGVQLFPFNTSTGVIFSTPQGLSGTPTTGFFAVAIDAANDLYIAGTNSGGSEVIESFPVAASSTSVTIGTLTSSKPVGNSPAWITVNAIGTSTTLADVYVANSKDSTISAFTASSGSLSLVNSGTAYAAPSGVAALGRDTSGNYLFALGFSTTSGSSTSSGLLPYTIGSGGGLSAGTGIATTTNSVPAIIAMTH
jgi:6-phosphogluconolactonase (cycloisomerase 2 family)